MTYLIHVYIHIHIFIHFHIYFYIRIHSYIHIHIHILPHILTFLKHYVTLPTHLSKYLIFLYFIQSSHIKTLPVILYKSHVDVAE